jgi:hypothetical protein
MSNKILSIVFALLFNTVMGIAVAAVSAFEPVTCIALSNIVGLSLSFIPLPAGFRAGVYKEVWTGKIIERFTTVHEGTFLDGVPDFSQYVGNDVIHLVECGIDPTVLIDNSTYPLAIEQLPDGDKGISLHKFETLVTAVTDDELYAISYDKIALKKDQHGTRIAETQLDYAIHAYAPAADSTNTPVVLTTGADDGNGRKKIIRADLVTLRRRLDNLKVPKSGRRLVLCNDHVNDLLEDDQKFRDQYYNYSTGAIAKAYGFDIYEYSNCPLFDQDLDKASFGAVASTGQYEASVFFYAPRMMRAKGSVDMYYSEAKTDPLNKRNLISFTARFVALPQTADKSCGAIVSAVVPPPPAG